MRLRIDGIKEIPVKDILGLIDQREALESGEVMETQREVSGGVTVPTTGKGCGR